MRNMINIMRSFYHTNKLAFIIALVVVTMFVLVSCTSGNAAYGAAPIGPIGGGCG